MAKAVDERELVHVPLAKLDRELREVVKGPTEKKWVGWIYCPWDDPGRTVYFVHNPEAQFPALIEVRNGIRTAVLWTKAERAEDAVQQLPADELTGPIAP